MKLVFALLLLAAPGLALADQAPPQWKLPEEGKNCFHQESYESEKITCGSQRTERWTCVTEAPNKFEAAEATHYLLVGEYISDVLNGCSPTFVVKQVVKQKKYHP